jgi:hypothetical protein
LICSGLSIASPVVSGVGTKSHKDVRDGAVGAAAGGGVCRIKSLEQSKAFFTRSPAKRPTSQTSAAERSRSTTRGVLYKTSELPFLITLPLLLAIPSRSLRMVSPIFLLIPRVGLAPLPAAIADHLGILGIGLALPAAVIGASSGLACGLTAHHLVGATWGKVERLAAIRAAARWKNLLLRGRFVVHP